MSTVPSSMTEFFHGNMKTKAAEGLLQNDGDYLYRSNKGEGFIVSVVFKGSPVHIKILPNEQLQGKLQINGKQSQVSTLSEVTKLLVGPNKAFKWPAALLAGIPGKPVEEPAETNQDKNTTPTRTTQAPTPAVATTPVQQKPSEVKADAVPTLKKVTRTPQETKPPPAAVAVTLPKLKSAPKRESQTVSFANTNVVPVTLTASKAPEGAPPKVHLPISAKDLNTSVRIYGVSCAGQLRSFGPKRGPGTFGKDAHCGVELDEPIGTHDGEVGGHRYFQCDPNKGIVVHASHVVRSSEYVSDGLNEGRVLEKSYPAFNNVAVQSDKEVEVSMTENYHGDISENDARALILSQSKAPAGTFLFSSSSEGGYRVSVLEITLLNETQTQEDVVVHRHITFQKNGTLSVGGRRTSSTNLQEMTKFLRNRQPGWPTRITMGVRGFKTVTVEELTARVDAEIEAEQLAERKKKQKDHEDLVAYRETTRQRKEQLKEQTFEEVDRADALKRELHSPEVLAARQHAADIVVERRKQILLQERREQLIDGHRKQFNKEREILQQALTLASALQRNQAVALDSDDDEFENAQPPPGFIDSDDEEDEVGAVEVWKKVEPVKRGSVKETSQQPILATAHDPMDNIAAYAWLMDGGAVEGKYLLRKVKKKSKKDTKIRYLLDVIEGGQPRSLEIDQDENGGFFREFSVNGEPTGQTSIDSVLQRLRTGMIGLPTIREEYAVAPTVSLNRKESKRMIKNYKQSMKKK